jgi:glyoxylase-like metal-dependent hydrolase (beta-lactamase superfamily II)
MTQAPVMIGLELPDVDTWSDRVVVALGQNPGIFTGPGTNTYLVGTGRERILLDAGDGKPAYLPVLERALEQAGGVSIQEIVVTHGHPDHMRGAAALVDRFGPLRVSKHPWPGVDEQYPVETTPLADGARLRTEGATLRAVHTPGHSEDHLCFVLEEEGTLFSGDNVLGVGTAVIPERGGDLLDYLRSLERLLEEEPRAIYPAHGPYIPNGMAKLREYLDHRFEREQQILDALAEGLSRVEGIVKKVYAAYPEVLHRAAGASVSAHLLKLEREGRVRREQSDDPLAARWEVLASEG